MLLPDGAQKYGLTRDIEVDAQGMVHACDKPSLGADIDFELIKNGGVELSCGAATRSN